VDHFLYAPQSLEGNIQYPGFVGGINWDSCATDPSQGTLICPVKNMGFVTKMFPRDTPVPDWCVDSFYSPQIGTPYYHCKAYFEHPDSKLPCIKPPWTKLVKIDLNKPEILWNVTIGFVPGYSPSWGTSRQRGGPILTKSGVVFLFNTDDSNLWGYDTNTGEQIFNYPLPGISYQSSSPIIYKLANKPFVVVNTFSPTNGTLIAFTIDMPEPPPERIWWWIGFSITGGVLFIIVVLLILKESKGQRNYTQIR